MATTWQNLPVPPDLIDNALGAIERRELTALQWGHVDGSLSFEDLDELVANVCEQDNAANFDSSSVIEALIDRKLIFEFSQANYTRRYRSRFAESVRLLTRLKQAFPNRPWHVAPDLVNDFRVDARPRLFPRRNLDVTQVLAHLGQRLSTPLSPLQETLLRDFLVAPGPPGTRAQALNLAQFQLDATTLVMEPARRDQALVVSAGTGTGKTIAFYLPAFLQIPAWATPGRPWVKALAVYPRVELLKDQFTEAFRLARRLNRTLAAHQRPLIVLGTFFGDTPYEANEQSLSREKWQRKARGFECPYLRCPEPGCDGAMIWRTEDLRAGREKLTCERGGTAPAGGCRGNTSDTELTLTRRTALQRLPDIVFTTTEMLHQRLSDANVRPVLGISANPATRARLLLLDEIHTYTGTTGAHAALVIRRWRHAIAPQPVQFVGLSATLENACAFMSELTGVDSRQTKEAKPLQEDMEPHGMHYQIVLRGDPASRTALLSTTIQSSFLLARLLDPPPGPGAQSLSGGRFGSRIFVFTDDLDVTNRLYDDLSNAEAYDIWHSPMPNRQPLAALRASGGQSNPTKDRAGQVWHVPEDIGWPLSSRLRVGRTSSQDRGVNQDSNVVVATAALEVGFNDPLVGGVIQHKSPHQMASFVQRRGRAGRSTKMRPWMVTILSDYGRDRLTYQAYETLYDPILRPQHLPIKNQYLLRMQSVFAFIDWLITALPNTRTWWWNPLRGPASGAYGPKSEREQKEVANLLKKLCDGDSHLEYQLAIHLSQALGLDEAEVKSLLYEPPRSLLLEVLPTLYRRLVTNWQACPPMDPARPPNPPDIQQSTGTFLTPLLDFAPPNLFSDLNLPEVTVVVPPAYTNAQETLESMPIAQALRVLVPGQVTRRFATERGRLSHWVPIPTAPVPTEPYPFKLDQYFSRYEYVADVPATVNGNVIAMDCYRPWTIKPSVVTDTNIDVTSRGRLNWESQFILDPNAANIPLPSHHEWSSHLQTLRFSLHGLRAPTIARRYAHSATVAFRRRIQAGSASDTSVTSYFVVDPKAAADEIDANQESGSGSGSAQRVAVGFEIKVDALGIDLNLPDGSELLTRAREAASLPAWRIARWRELVLGDPLLSASPTTSFQREWLEQVYSSALVATACRQSSQLDQADRDLHAADPSATFDEVIRSVFRLQDAEDSDVEDKDDAPTTSADAIRALLAKSEVLSRLRMLSTVLWHPIDNAFIDWLQDRLHETVGEALLHACSHLTPQHAAFDTLVLDLADEPGQTFTTPVHGATTSPKPPRRVIISETMLGGGGVLQEVADAVARDPQSLAQALGSVTAPSDQETVADGLERFLTLIRDDDTLADTVAELRLTQDYIERDTIRVSLHRQLAQHGLLVDHSLSSALNHRLLRSGTSVETDRLFADLLESWRDATRLLGVIIPLRTFAYLSATSPTYRPRLHQIVTAITGVVVDDTDLAAVLSGLLWAQPDEVRRRTLETYNPFRIRGFTDPSLIRELLLVHPVTTVELGTDNWLEALTSAIATNRVARLRTSVTRTAKLQAALAQLIATPVSLNFLQFYPVIERVERHGQLLFVSISLPEFA